MLFLLLSAVGSGPAVWLIRERRIRFAAMPLVGFAISASLLTSVGRLLPLDAVTWTVLLPLAALSLAAAVIGSRRKPSEGAARALAVPAAALLVGMAVALAPPLINGTQGPFALNVYDAWGYAATSSFLQHHKIGETVPPETVRTDVVTWNGSNGASGNSRIGVDSVNAAAATLFGIETGAALAPLLAVLFGLLPVVVWLLVSGLGGSPRATVLGAAFGLTPAMLSLVEDTALGNLAGEVLVAPILLLAALSLRRSITYAIAAGLLLGGLFAVYPEYLPPLALIALCGGIAFAVVEIRRGKTGDLLVLGISRAAVISTTAIATAPFASLRAFRYLSERTGDGPWAQGLPLRWIDEQNVGAWGFGVLHLYEMGGFSDLSLLRRAFAILFPVLLAAVVVYAVATQFRLLSVFVAVPIAISAALGLYAYKSFQEGRCEYCLWKSLTLMLPFLAAGLAFGLDRLWAGSGKDGRLFALRRSGAAAVAVMVLIALVYADFRLIRTTHRNGAFCPSEFAAIDDRLERLPSKSPLLIEGAGSMRKPTFMMNAIYSAARGQGRPILFDAGYPAIVYLVTIEAAPSYYSPDYSYVLTPFGDVKSDRRTLGIFGPVTLVQRAPIDIVVSHPDLAVESKGPRIPWVWRPFNLRIASDRAMDGAIVLTLSRPAGSTSTLSFELAGQPLEARANGNRLCLQVRLAKGETNIAATPVLDRPELHPSPTLRHDLGLADIRAEAGSCSTFVDFS